MIRLAVSDQEVERCFGVISQLRPHLEESTFTATVRRQQRGGYELVYLEAESEIVAVAGFRLLEKLHTGRSLYVDDLVTDEAHRSEGHGHKLLAWLVQRAGENGCSCLELDSGVQRFDAHRFYLMNRMILSSHHFTLKL